MRHAFAVFVLLSACQQQQTAPEKRIDSLEERVRSLEAKKQLPNPMSLEEYKIIPAGTRYLAPDGSVRVKAK